MKITVEPTGRFESVNGNECRIWKGATERGTLVELYVALVRMPASSDCSELDQALREVKAEQRLASFDIRLVI